MTVTDLPMAILTMVNQTSCSILNSNFALLHMSLSGGPLNFVNELTCKRRACAVSLQPVDFPTSKFI